MCQQQTLTKKERQSVSKMVMKLEALSSEFKTYHCTILDQTDEQKELVEEQVILDKHKDKDEQLMEPLQELVAMTEPVIPTTPGTGNYQSVATCKPISEAENLIRQMNQVHNSLTRAKRVVDDKDKEVDMCVLEGHEERIKRIDVELQGIKQDMLLVEDYESLAKKTR